nr:MAG TPA: hypothetical protein [Bacteriophage sp.]DAR23186.1 MAG TPA: hypothetical protein [Caudoviricetes sp.]
MILLIFVERIAGTHVLVLFVDKQNTYRRQ